MRIGDLIEYTTEEPFSQETPDRYIGLVIALGENSIKVLWCFGGEEEYYDPMSWLSVDEVKLISKRT